MATAKCIVCKKSVEVIPSRLNTFKFCSYKCRSKWRSEHWTGANHPQYQEGPRTKICLWCCQEFAQRETEAISEFRKRKFCSRGCAKFGQLRRTGEHHPLFKPDSRRKNRRGKHGAWARAIISRDCAKCQECGITGVELHAHHIREFSEYPDLRWELSNGITLCFRCHWAVHSASNANGVNSGNIQTGKAEDNPEPSFGRKPIEGVTTRGRVYRRFNGSCDWCSAPISKTWSDTKGKAALFCSRSCASKWRVATGRSGWGRPRR